ncbi:MAG: hypothetical protein A4E70_01895 [Syntrophus sp. PtaU1.Bin005]|nr:MAG: hypothetical protein A4E70_01895 [Syntrophus sp. PtaU1.Bin005]
MPQGMSNNLLPWVCYVLVKAQFRHNLEKYPWHFLQSLPLVALSPPENKIFRLPALHDLKHGLDLIGHESGPSFPAFGVHDVYDSPAKVNVAPLQICHFAHSKPRVKA